MGRGGLGGHISIGGGEGGRGMLAGDWCRTGACARAGWVTDGGVVVVTLGGGGK